MIRRLAANPAAVVLAVLTLLCLIGTVWGVQKSSAGEGITTEGEPTAAQMWQMHVMRIAALLPPIVAFVGVAALLGVLAIASASRRGETPPRSEEPA